MHFGITLLTFKEMVEVAGEDEQELAAEMAAAFLNEQLPESTFGAPRAGSGMWASIVRIINPVDGRTLHQIHLEQNEAAFSVALVKFACQPDDQFVLVGVAKHLKLRPRELEGGAIYTYHIGRQGDKLHLVHKTLIEEVYYTIVSYLKR